MKIFSYSGVQFPSGFPKVEKGETINPLQLKTSHEKHMKISQKPYLNDLVPNQERIATNFAESLNQFINSVESLTTESDELTKKAVYDPDSVDVHEIMIAAQKSRFAINLTKTVTDGLVRAYKELITPR
ncbi:MAG: flagellar hook-basal body complex protein FliE [Leptonema sp. (in: bacteria)]